MHGGHGLVGREDAHGGAEVCVAGGALVVDDDVVSLRPIGIVIDWQRRVGALVVRPVDIDLHVGARLDSLAEHFCLPLVVVATTACYQQGFERLGFCSCRKDRQKSEKQGGGDRDLHELEGVELSTMRTPGLAQEIGGHLYAFSSEIHGLFLARLL